MSYLVLARKWRPQSFDDLVGQESVVRTIKNAIAQKRVAHAYVFSGPRGVGKTTTARLLSKALNCVDGPTSDPCGACPSCTAIAGGSAVDVIEIDGASNNSVNDVRNLRETVQYAPAAGRYKIYIIDEVHMLSDSAFNALLKTLEEPPSHVFFIFATTSPRKIPVTVLSRCQHLGFKRVAKSVVVDHLAKICKAESVSADEGALEMIARQAGGSVRDALTLLDQASAFSDRITEAELVGMLGLPESGTLRSITEAVLAGDRLGIVRLVARLAESGADLRVFPKELAGLARNLVVAKVAGDDRGLLDLPEDELAWVLETASTAGAEHLTLVLEEFLNLSGEMRDVAVPRYALELGLLRASFFRGATSFESLIARLEELPGGQDRPAPPTAQSGPSTAAEPAPGPPSVRPAPATRENSGALREPTESYGSPPTVSEDSDDQDSDCSAGADAAPRFHGGSGNATLSAGDLWSRVCREAERNGGLLPSLMASLSPKSLSNGVLEIVPGPGVNGFAVEKIQAEVGFIESLITAALGKPGRLRIGKTVDSGPVHQVPETGDPRKAALEHPLVQTALDMFEGRITDVHLSGEDG